MFVWNGYICFFPVLLEGGVQNHTKFFYYDPISNLVTFSSEQDEKSKTCPICNKTISTGLRVITEERGLKSSLYFIYRARPSFYLQCFQIYLHSSEMIGSEVQVSHGTDSRKRLEICYTCANDSLYIKKSGYRSKEPHHFWRNNINDLDEQTPSFFRDCF